MEAAAGEGGGGEGGRWEGGGWGWGADEGRLLCFMERCLGLLGSSGDDAFDGGVGASWAEAWLQRGNAHHGTNGCYSFIIAAAAADALK